MSKSAIYTANTSAQAVASAGTSVNFGNTVRRYGCNVSASGTSIVLSGSGYYGVSVNVVATPTAAGTISAQLYKDGVAIAGAFATGVTTAATTPVTLPIGAIVRNVCCVESALTVSVSGADGNVTNVSTVVEKL